MVAAVARPADSASSAAARMPRFARMLIHLARRVCIVVNLVILVRLCQLRRAEQLQEALPPVDRRGRACSDAPPGGGRTPSIAFG